MMRDRKIQCQQSSSEWFSAGSGHVVHEIVFCIVLLGLNASLVSCVSYTYHVILPSSKAAALAEKEKRPTLFLGTGEGEACVRTFGDLPQAPDRIAISPLGIDSPMLPFEAFQDAVRKAVESKQGTDLVGFTADLRTRNYVVFAQHCICVKGMVVTSR
jgi:hypothetical protein